MKRSFQRGEVVRYDGSLSPYVAELPHYHLVPKERKAHLAYRLKVYKAAENNLALQEDLLEKCAKDILFFVNTFLWIVEPREGEEQTGIVPFNTWVHQDPVIAASWKYLGVRHQAGDKSRAQGASYLELAIQLHTFLFRPNSFLGMGSKDEETADDQDSPDSLGWKFDFLLSNLPTWMCPPGLVDDRHVNRSYSKSTWRNVRNGSFLKALSSTKGIGRGGRYTRFFLDESSFFLPGYDREAVANLLRTTNNLVMWSTPNTPDCDHYERLYPPKPSIWLTLILDWQDNPDQKRGLYTTRNGKLLKLDPDYVYPEDYEFILDGRRRSPWFDLECEIMGWNYLLIDRELNRSWSASVGRPFKDELLNKHRKYTMDPMRVGRVQYADLEPTWYEHINWIDGEAWEFDLWMPLDGNNNPPENRYVVGVDISQGTAGETSSNSVLSIWNPLREQMGELATNNLDPKEFAQLTVAVLYWLGRGVPSPYLIFERNGPGVTFATEIMRLGYTNIYYQKAADDTRRWSKTLDVPGYHTSNTAMMLDPLLGAMMRQECVVRSAAMLEEAGIYEFDGRRVIHPRSKSTRDKSAQNENHGDRVVAAAMAMRAFFDKPSLKAPETVIQPRDCPKNSIGGRIYQWEEAERQRNDFLVKARSY